MKKLILLFCLFNLGLKAQTDSTVNLRLVKIEQGLDRAKSHFVVSGLCFLGGATLGYLNNSGNIAKANQKVFRQSEFFFYGIGALSLITVAIEF